MSESKSSKGIRPTWAIQMRAESTRSCGIGTVIRMGVPSSCASNRKGRPAGSMSGYCSVCQPSAVSDCRK
ncbi:Uncharacterised protein [Mycobacteroides abscessus subsp. abscessus]|nr:Uncharacterised protein [Mycobacteroides abscessus subsp. abscessus]